MHVAPQAAPSGATIHGLDLSHGIDNAIRASWRSPNGVWFTAHRGYAATGGYQGQARLLHRITVGECTAG